MITLESMLKEAEKELEKLQHDEIVRELKNHIARLKIAIAKRDKVKK